MLLMNKKVLLLNFQFRCSDGTEHEPGPRQVGNTFSLTDHITGEVRVYGLHGCVHNIGYTPNRTITREFELLPNGFLGWCNGSESRSPEQAGFAHFQIIPKRPKWTGLAQNDPQIPFP